MRHYLLTFIKTSIFNESKIQLYYTLEDERKEKIINDFFVKIGSFEVLPYIFDFNYTDPTGIDKKFSTCGETTLLNLLNKCLIKEDGSFRSIETFCEPLKAFYRVFYTMKIQLAKQDETTKAWLDVVSNLPKRDVYYPAGDIIPNKQNIEYVLQTILNSSKTEIIDIIQEINDAINVEILLDNKDIFKILIDKKIEVYFTDGHAEMNTIEQTNDENKIEWDDNDCKSLYEIFSTVDYYNNDYIQELSLSVLYYLNREEDKEIKTSSTVDFFLSSIKKLDVFLPIRLATSIDKLVNLESLTIIRYKDASGLPDSIQKLVKLNQLVVEVMDTEIPEWIGKLKNLKILRFSNCGITKLPDSLQELDQLEDINLSGGLLTNLPEWFGNTFTNLLSLTVVNNHLKSLPESIGKLKKLQELNCEYNRLTILPESLGNLENLQELYFESNRLNTLPESFGKLVNLRELRLVSNRFASLPDSIGNLSKLEGLLLSRNNLTSLPLSIGNLKELKKLSIFLNKLTSLPESICELTNLLYLHLNFNNISSLPKSIDNLLKLKELEIENNKLTSLPESIGKLTNLEKLSAERNKLTILPNSIGDLSNLENLNLFDNKLTLLPESIGKLKKLLLLDLNDNKLEGNLPNSIGDLSNLKILDLGDNKLTILPNSIGNLLNLENLNLVDNKLTSLPESITELKNTTITRENNCFISSSTRL